MQVLQPADDVTDFGGEAGGGKGSWQAPLPQAEDERAQLARRCRWWLLIGDALTSLRWPTIPSGFGDGSQVIDEPVQVIDNFLSIYAGHVIVNGGQCVMECLSTNSDGGDVLIEPVERRRAK
ncbi:hypothetical protein DI270_014840 [Microbispora triticiradicis]|uniref:Uncharacterized protein n=1 Tax=Microbispora triticiradicis TaxID=2200763 RepID=A0ABX9LL30_9ACTN|nr:hypothetical protein [Microbispora triticiradicis]RGA04303.1 hypothetical protein DI270_014840 [Microbispora triticiradicis]